MWLTVEKIYRTYNSIQIEIEDLVPIPRQSGLRFLTPSGVNANPNNRMNAEQWKRFSGWCGHQHVPKPNDHVDPGAIDIQTLLS